VLKGILKNHRFHSSDAIKTVVPKVWDNLTFDDVQRVFHNWVNYSAWAIKNGGEYTLE
jgi:arabinogalactan endo-1,4-beta-galactosidase